MNASRFSLAVVFASLTFTLATPASASVAIPVNTVAIGGLFNTGVDDSGTALVGGDGVTDTHYTVFSSDLAVTTGVNAVTYTHPSYVGNSATSRWISHSSNGSPGNGTTVFRLTFDLTGLDPATAVISGLNAVDNAGLIVLNNQATGIALNGSFNQLVAFSITTGFVAGINTLDFAVTDFGPPLALRIADLHGTAQLAAVPLPASVLMFAPALLGLGALRRKRAIV